MRYINTELKSKKIERKAEKKWAKVLGGEIIDGLYFLLYIFYNLPREQPVPIFKTT